MGQKWCFKKCEHNCSHFFYNNTKIKYAHNYFEKEMDLLLNFGHL